MGWRNVCWGSDYPHFEGTYGHTQKTLHELSTMYQLSPDAEESLSGAFQELFPHIPQMRQTD